jgi:hypothetical protein
MVIAPSGINRVISKTAGKTRLKVKRSAKVIIAPARIRAYGFLSPFFAFIILRIRNTKLEIIRRTTIIKKLRIPFSTVGVGTPFTMLILLNTKLPIPAHNENTTIYGTNINLYQKGNITFSFGNIYKKLKKENECQNPKRITIFQRCKYTSGSLV